MLGEFVLPGGRGIWTNTIIDALATLGVTERNARQALARLRDQEVVRTTKHGRKARWHLTESGRELLASGAERIYNFGTEHPTWDGQWTVVICPIPETQREKRRQFRTRLEFEGFGFIAPTIAISPHIVRESVANELLTELQLVETSTVFKSKTGTLTADARLLRDAWDIGALASQYQTFIDEFDEVDPSSALVAVGSTIAIVDEWRRFPFVDPELPVELLPEPWIGTAAKAVFDVRRAAWHEPALSWLTENA